MSRIKIKSRSTSKEKKLKLIEILCKQQIEISRILPVYDGFVVLTVSESHADCIFSAETKGELEAQEFYAVMPPELRAKKSVIIPRADDIIYERHIVDIGEEIQNQNSWVGEGVVDVIKFAKSKAIKITFSNITLAQKCTEKGLKAFSISIPAHEIKQETFIPVKCCMKCYTLESHFTNECPKPSTLKICSECSETGHVWHECPNEYKKCLNCGENHSTMALKCPKRKEIVKNKRNQINERQKMSYATISQTTSSDNKMPNVQTPIVTKEELLKIHICVAHAQSQNQITPGTYSSELNKVLKANNLPTIIIPEESDETIEITQQETEIGATAKETKLLKPKPTQRTPKNIKSSETHKLQAIEIGLEFYTTKERKWPDHLSIDDLIAGIQRNIYKWTYNDNRYTEEEILRKTSKGEINCDNARCWFSVENDEFRRIRSGLIKERSPIEDRDPRRLKPSSHSYTN